MSSVDNASLSPGAIRSPLVDARGYPATAWAAFFNYIWVNLRKALNSTVINQSTQAALPTLGTGDAGALYWVTDYNHLLEWTGSAWQWGPGESGSGYIQLFTVAPVGVGWALCNGAVTNYLNANGTTGSITLPNLTGNASYLKAGLTYSGVINGPINPTTGNPNATTLVGAGAATNVAAAAHQHTVALPGDPISNLVMLPYFRI